MDVIECIYNVKFICDLYMKLRTETSGPQSQHSPDRSTKRFWENGIVKLLWMRWITNALYI